MNQEEQPEVVAATSFSPRGDTAQKKRWRARPLQIALATLLLAFSMAMWFLFTAKSVLLTFDPVDSELNIDGGLHITLGERYLMRSGDYEISVEAEGHYPLQQPVSIGTEDQQEFHYKLQRLPGKLSFLSTPDDARILLDEELLGNTPLNDVSVAAGEHELRVLAERYLPYRQSIEGTPEPNGLTPRELFPMLRRLGAETNLVGIELVELNPLVDPTYVTPLVANRCAREILTGIAMRKKGMTEKHYLAPETTDHGQG